MSDLLGESDWFRVYCCSLCVALANGVQRTGSASEKRVISWKIWLVEGLWVMTDRAVARSGVWPAGKFEMSV